MSYAYLVSLADDPTEVGSPKYHAIAEILLTQNMPNDIFVVFVASSSYYTGTTLSRTTYKIKLSFEAGGIRPMPGQVFNITFAGVINDSATPTVLTFPASTTMAIVPGEDYDTSETIAYTDVDTTTIPVNLGSTLNKAYKTTMRVMAYYSPAKISTDGLRLHIMNVYTSNPS